MKKIFFMLTLVLSVVSENPIYASGQMEAVTQSDNTDQPGRMVIVDRSYDVFNPITRSYEKGKLDLSSWADPGATRLNCYQLSNEDCCRIGLQKNSDKAVDIVKGVEQFISQLKVHLPNLHQLVFRGEERRCTALGEVDITCVNATIARDVYFTLKDQGYKVTLCYWGEYDSQIDRLLSRWSLPPEQFCGFMHMAWLGKSTEDILKFTPSLSYEYEQGAGRLAQRIVDGGFERYNPYMPKYEETEKCLHRAIAAYSRIAKDNLGLSMILHTSIPACDVALERFMRFIYLAAAKKTPTLLDTVITIHEKRLYYGTDLMESYYTAAGKVGGFKLHLICHQDTEMILTALREFIPDWTQEDFGQEYLQAKKNNELFRTMPHYEDLEMSEVYVGVKDRKITRRILFKTFCEALGRYEQATQLIRLQRLLKVIQLEHFQTVEGLVEQLHRALGYIYEETQNRPDVDAFLTQKRADGFNPLLNSSLYFSRQGRCNLI